MRVQFNAKTFNSDTTETLLGSGVVGGHGGVASGVTGLHLVDGNLVAAVRSVITVHGDSFILLQFHSIFEAVIRSQLLTYIRV